jgi:hypothetical protein
MADLKVEKATVESERRTVEADLGACAIWRSCWAPRTMTCSGISSSLSRCSRTRPPCSCSWQRRGHAHKRKRACREAVERAERPLAPRAGPHSKLSVRPAPKFGIGYGGPPATLTARGRRRALSDQAAQCCRVERTVIPARSKPRSCSRRSPVRSASGGNAHSGRSAPEAQRGGRIPRLRPFRPRGSCRPGRWCAAGGR